MHIVLRNLVYVPTDPALTIAPLSAVSVNEGEVLWAEQYGNLVFMSGGFATVTDANGTYTRNNTACLDASTGLWTSWTANCNGLVWRLAPTAGGVYLAGDFTTVNGSTRNRAAKVDLATGGTTDGTYDPNLNNGAAAQLVAGSTVYLGGNFTTVNGSTARIGMAAVDASTGAATSFVCDTNTGAKVQDFYLNGSSLWVSGGGNAITTFNGTSRRNIAKVNASTGAVDTAFDAGLGSYNGDDVCHIVPNVDGSKLYLIGIFPSVGGSTRVGGALVTASTGAVDSSFNPAFNAGANITCAAILDGWLYIGGIFTSLNAGASSASYGARVSLTTGTADAYSMAGSFPYAIAKVGDYIFFLGSFTSEATNAVTGGTSSRKRFAAYTSAGALV